MNSVRAAEGIRIALGLITYIDEIAILFTGNGVWTFNGLKPEKGSTMANSLEQIGTFLEMEQRVLVDKESCEKRSIVPKMEGVEVISTDDARKAIRNTKHIVTIR
tara:strand:+ start:18007 stop:18321 length:315 start_codon:yes stop_codon:yes gene_type:complete